MNWYEKQNKNNTIDWVKGLVQISKKVNEYKDRHLNRWNMSITTKISVLYWIAKHNNFLFQKFQQE